MENQQGQLLRPSSYYRAHQYSKEFWKIYPFKPPELLSIFLVFIRSVKIYGIKEKHQYYMFVKEHKEYICKVWRATTFTCSPAWEIEHYQIFFFFLMWTSFEACIEFIIILRLFYILVFWPRGLWDLSSPTRSRIHAHWPSTSKLVKSFVCSSPLHPCCLPLHRPPFTWICVYYSLALLSNLTT